MLYLFYMVSITQNAVAGQRENTSPCQITMLFWEFPPNAAHTPRRMAYIASIKL